MTSDAEEGLLVSVLIYLVAAFAALALVVVPVLWANGPTIRENVGPNYAGKLLALRRSDNKFPVAKLEHQELINPARNVELLARAKKAQNSRPQMDRARQTRQTLHGLAPQRAQLAQKVRHPQIAESYATPPRVQSWQY
jgi:hypothetical protein